MHDSNTPPHSTPNACGRAQAGHPVAGTATAVTSGARTPNLPDVPTVAETLPGYEFYSWYGLWGPAKLPADITQRLNTEVNKALAEMTPKLKEQGLLTTPGSVEDFAKFQRSDMERSQKIVTEGNIRVE